MPKTAPDPGPDVRTPDLDGIEVEGHVRQALEVAARHAGSAGIDARALLLAAVELGERVRSRAFRTLAGLLGPRAVDLAKGGAPPAKAAGAPLAAPLAESFARHRAALLASGFWGRDLVTLALLAAADPSLARLASETGVALEGVRHRWFEFLSGSGEHRTPEAWAAWWTAEGLEPPDVFPSPEQKAAYGTAAAGEALRVDPDAGAAEGALKGDFPFRDLEDLEDLEDVAGPPAEPVGERTAPALDDFDGTVWLTRLTDAALALIGSAAGLAEAAPGAASDAAAEIGVAHLLAAAADEPGGILGTVLERTHLGRERFLGALPDPDAPPFPPSWSPVPVEARLPRLARDAREALVVAFERAGAEQVDARHVVDGALSFPRVPAVVRLRALGLTRSSLPWAVPLPILQAGYRSDSASGEDRLGVLREARTLAAVMASTAVDPPLSIGLFGPWGSGKSFFMRLLQEEVHRLSASGSEGYWRNVVQIRFNAWHYIDGNLWASLASEVFEQLGREVEARERKASEEKAGVRRAHLLMAARQSRSALEEAEARRVELTDELARARAEVETLRGEHWRERAATSAPRVAREAIERLGTESGLRLRAEVQRAMEQLGLPADDLDPERVRRALSGWGRVRAWWQAVRTSSPRQWVWLGVGLAVAVVVAWRGGTWIGALSGLVAKVVSTLSLLLVGAAPVIRASWGRMHALLREVRPVAAKFEEFAGEVRTQLEAEEHARVELVLKQLDTAKKREEAARTRLGAVEAELATLFEADRLSSFVQERRKSRYYEEQLGVIAQARQDFEQLSRLLHKRGADATQVTEFDAAAEEALAALRQGIPEVDRIVLYIDDLDRCPEEQVVDVLQAVHLLLAFPLFVVVVGVDPRWLIHSLADRSEVFRAAETPLEGDDDGRRHWRSTPLDYLEKIFQIPFHLRPMGEEGFGALIDDITADAGASAAAPPAATPPAEGVGGAGVAEGGASAGGARGETDVGAAAGTPGTSDPGTTGAAPPADEGSLPEGSAAEEGDRDREEDGAAGESSEPIPEPQLSIAPWERTFMKALHPFIASPRAAKRYVNVYRLIRATHIAPALGPLFELEAEDDPSVRDGHRTVLLMLAMLTGFPRQAIAFFRSVVEDPAGSPLRERLDALRAAVAEVGAEAPRERAEAAAEPVRARPDPGTDDGALPDGDGGEEAAPSQGRPGHAGRAGHAGHPGHPGGMPASEWTPFLDAVDLGLRELEEREIRFEPTASGMRAWIPSVARYAFVSGQALRDDGLREG